MPSRVLRLRSVFVIAALATACETPLGAGRDAEVGDAGIAADAESLLDGASSADAGATGTCEGVAPPSGSALRFDGADDHVTMGAAPSLGLATFTLEAWIRRDARGAEMGTGVGGLRLVPIMGKGRGESDGTNLDCNYAFGLVGDVLGADFEDMASGANHPVVGRTTVTRGTWHHVAATYDGTTWRLYLDGALDAERRVSATPRADSIQHFAIGTAMNSMGVAAGRFAGAIDEVRVWDRALSDSEIATGMGAMLSTGAGLVGRWALDEGASESADAVGANPGAVVGEPAYETPGAPLDVGRAPAIVDTLPLDGVSVPLAEVELAVGFGDVDSAATRVRFHLRELSSEDDFTIAVLPDTQYYTVESRGLSRYFYDQTDWIMDNREAYDILAVIHNGDLVDHGDQFAYEWMVADRAMSTLESVEPGLPDGLPYGISVGNHDQEPRGSTGNTTEFNRHFGVARFASRGYYGGHYGSTNDESYFTFAAGGLDFVVVNLQFDDTPDAAVIAWARAIFEAHPDAFGILNSHYIVGRTGNFGPQGRAIYDGLRDVQNLHLMTSGHVTAEARREDTFEGHTIHSMLADYQFRDEGGSGYMRIWEMSPANGELTVRTYSPTLDVWETDADSEFTIPVDLRGAGPAFTEVGVVERAVGRATFRPTALEPGRLYEWYASVDDCTQSTRSPLQRFRTAP